MIHSAGSRPIQKQARHANLLGQQREERPVDDGRRRPAERPAALHGADGFRAMLRRADGLGHHDRHDRPFTAEADALQRARGEQLPERMREAGQEGEDREGGDGPLQHADAAVAVGKNAGEPAADRRRDQRTGGDHAGFAFGHAPRRDQRRNEERVDHEVEGVDCVAAEAGVEGAAFALGQFGEPLERGHVLLWSPGFFACRRRAIVGCLYSTGMRRREASRGQKNGDETVTEPSPVPYQLLPCNQKRLSAVKLRRQRSMLRKTPPNTSTPAPVTPHARQPQKPARLSAAPRACRAGRSDFVR